MYNIMIINNNLTEILLLVLVLINFLLLSISPYLLSRSDTIKTYCDISDNTIIKTREWKPLLSLEHSNSAITSIWFQDNLSIVFF